MRPALVVPSFPLWALLVSIATLSGERCEYEPPVRFLPASQQAERAQHASTRACYAVRRRCPRAGRSTPEARRVRCSAITARDTASSLCISDSSVACSTYRILSRSVQDSSSAAQLVRCTRLQQARASVSLCCPVRGIHRRLTRVNVSRRNGTLVRIARGARPKRPACGLAVHRLSELDGQQTCAAAGCAARCARLPALSDGVHCRWDARALRWCGDCALRQYGHQQGAAPARSRRVARPAVAK
jgi:hypothetical protein